MRTYDLDLQTHRFPSADGRHWSSPEQADHADGKIPLDESRRITVERIARGDGYVNKRRVHVN